MAAHRLVCALTTALTTAALTACFAVNQSGNRRRYVGIQWIPPWIPAAWIPKGNSAQWPVDLGVRSVLTPSILRARHSANCGKVPHLKTYAVSVLAGRAGWAECSGHLGGRACRPAPATKNPAQWPGGWSDFKSGQDGWPRCAANLLLTTANPGQHQRPAQRLPAASTMPAPRVVSALGKHRPRSRS